MLIMSEGHKKQIIDHAFSDYPNECCGIVAGTGDRSAKVYPVTNTARSPKRYLMDAQEQLNAMLDARDNSWDILGLYHSHPRSAAYPSYTDVRLAIQGGWTDVCFLLVSLQDQEEPQLRAFDIRQNDTIVERVLRIV